MSDGMLSLDEVMQYLSLNKEGIEALIKKDKLHAYKIGGVYLRFKKEQVIAVKKHSIRKEKKSHVVVDRVHDFWDFYNFYIVAGVCLILVLYLSIR